MRIKAAVVRDAGEPFTSRASNSPGRPPARSESAATVSICHTDIGVQRQWLPVLLPPVLGHEGAGEVEAVGSDVTGLAVGDKVLMSFESCGTCQLRRRGLPAYCVEFAMRNVSGGRPDGSSPLSTPDGTWVNGSFFAQSTFATYAIATQRNAT